MRRSITALVTAFLTLAMATVGASSAYAVTGVDTTWRWCIGTSCSNGLRTSVRLGQTTFAPTCAISPPLASGSVPSAVASVPNGMVGPVMSADMPNHEAFAVSLTGAIWHNYLTSYAVQSTANGPVTQPLAWSGWSSLGGPASGGVYGKVSAGRNYVGNVEAYVRGLDGLVYHSFQTPGVGSGWSGWDSMGKPAVGIRGDVYEGTNNHGDQELYVVGLDGNVYHSYATPGIGSGWSAWSTLGRPAGGAIVGDVQVGMNSVCNQELFVTGTDGRVHHMWATPGVGSGWSGWYAMTAPGSPAAGQVFHGYSWNRQFLAVVGADGNLYETHETPGQFDGWGVNVLSPKYGQTGGWVNLGVPPSGPITHAALYLGDDGGTIVVQTTAGPWQAQRQPLMTNAGTDFWVWFAAA